MTEGIFNVINRYQGTWPYFRYQRYSDKGDLDNQGCTDIVFKLVGIYFFQNGLVLIF